ncbi:Anaphase-promoting complex subunit 4 [Geodia barretti]|uniref:Anaphase-promoting complex subunit 4 n=1 Tax=Geodia barretti TaxID=519541 RepID=A0AA35SKB8_GEOBA|nr:Anaphase-promoting complex subunit 4 [Geodia barretti]
MYVFNVYTLCLPLQMSVDLIRERYCELQHLSLLYSHVSSLLHYTSDTLRCMTEAWEDVLLTMDIKLAKYSTTLKEGASVADELLVLLACGRARSELRDFLLDELTAKGVKKIGLSLETSYTRVRKYSLNCLSSVIQALQFHLGEVLGMARWKERFGNLGISTDSLQVCIKSLGTFALKNQELQSVIDESLKSMKSFFMWIYVVILKLGEEPVPSNMKQHLNAEELKLVVHFLKKRLAKSAAGSSQSFNLELVGQYLVDEDLKIVEEKQPSFWERLLQEAELDSNAIPWLFSPSPVKSLLQLLNSLVRDVAAAFATTKETICQTFTPKPSVPLLPSTTGDSEVSKIDSKIGELVCEGKRCVYYPSARDLFLVVYGDETQQMRCCRACVRGVPGLADQEKSGTEPLNLLSVQVYNGETLSVLLEYRSSERDDVMFNAVAQLPVKPVLNLANEAFGELALEGYECHDVGRFLTQIHSLGPFHAVSMAVSGPRRLAAVFSRRTKKVRLFDVDAEEEEEEEEEEG